MLWLSAAGLLALGLRPRRLLGAEASGEGFAFIAVNDLHFSDAACRPWFEKVVVQMKQSAPEAEFCLLGADLADQGTPSQLTGIRDAFAKLEIPVHVVVGNHDYKPPLRRPTRECMRRMHSTGQMYILGLFLYI